MFLSLLFSFFHLPPINILRWLKRDMKREKNVLIVPLRGNSTVCHTHFHLVVLLTGPFHWETHNKTHSTASRQHVNTMVWNKRQKILKLMFTDGPRVQLCVQNLQRMHQVPLRAGRGHRWIRWTHFLFFFVLHLRIDVEAWDLPWGKIYSEAEE